KMPMQRERYPLDWPTIARSIKEACGWICQGCGKACRRPGEPFQGHRYTLTVAHTYPPDHAPDAAVVCVAALCAPCHLRFDAERKARVRWAKRGAAGAQLPLVEWST
ncbi:MAG TPA: hypothetical protein VNK95_15575, partial [Caldilineaceae bacterium]|nr:hypothetical protein [Caldilineaceae bacterium]